LFWNQFKVEELLWNFFCFSIHAFGVCSCMQWNLYLRQLIEKLYTFEFSLMLIAIVWRLWEVCRATAAAPTYFPPAYVTSVDGTVNGTLIDGGAIQNNPVSTPAWLPDLEPQTEGLEIQYCKCKIQSSHSSYAIKDFMASLPKSIPHPNDEVQL
jgi:hypothetical protein